MRLFDDPGYDGDTVLDFAVERILGESADAWHLRVDGMDFWLPKSVGELDGFAMEALMPQWLAEREGLV